MGRNIAAKNARAISQYLKVSKGYEMVYIYLTGIYALPSLLRLGFKIEERSYYDEFEYKGQKIFKDIPNHKYYIDGRPAGYLLSIDL